MFKDFCGCKFQIGCKSKKHFLGTIFETSRKDGFTRQDDIQSNEAKKYFNIKQSEVPCWSGKLHHPLSLHYSVFKLNYKTSHRSNCKLLLRSVILGSITSIYFIIILTLSIIFFKKCINLKCVQSLPIAKSISNN